MLKVKPPFTKKAIKEMGLKAYILGEINKMENANLSTLSRKGKLPEKIANNAITEIPALKEIAEQNKEKEESEAE